MTWNHRVVKRTWTDLKEPMTQYSVHEAYYDENGKVFAITKNPVYVSYCDNIEELREYVQWIMNSLDHPVLDYDNIPEEGAVDPGEDLYTDAD